MATAAATRKPRATKPRETAAAKRARLAVEQADAAPVAEQITETVKRLPAAPDVPGGAPVLGTASDAPEVERDTLFHYNGVAYTIPKTFSKRQTLGYAHVARTQGLTSAIDWAMEQALGTVGFAVLLDSGVSDEQLDNMMSLVMIRIEGLPDPK